ncbi:penicillin-binding protein 2 [bacterium]|nr:penicillin-binding protein 2 [bacterium]
MLFIFIVLARLYFLQIMKGEHYQNLADETFIRVEETVAKRGNIVDRNGAILADTRTYYEIVMIPQYLDEKEKIIDSLLSILPLTKEDILEKLAAARFEAKFQPVVIVDDAPYDWVAKVREHILPEYDPQSDFSLNGVDVRFYPLRRYLHPEVFAHALGYLREIDQAALKKAREEQPGVFTMRDLIGAAGLEYAYEIALKGSDGVLARVVNARGREVTTDKDLNVLKKKATVNPKAGQTLMTTIDFNAQLAAYEAFQELGKKGTVVALDPQTGEILALLSYPGFDANRITKNIDKEYWKMINLHEDKYLYNRAIQGMYPPASTYKVIGLTAGIDTGKIDPETKKVSCSGGMHFGNRYFKCWTAHGTLNTLHGLSRSCDVFFYKLGLALGVDGLAAYAKMFGLGAKTGIEIPYEKSGLVPTSAWKEKRYKQKWYESETLSVSIGQSYNLVTPLQNAVVAAMVANGGYKVWPHLGKALFDQQGSLVNEIKGKTEPTTLVGSKGLEWAKKGMIEVVHGYGTAGRLKQSPNKIAGKTGTAQVVGHGAKVKKGVNTENHGLFIAFAPYDDPKIAVSVVVEHGRGGSATAAPVAMKVIDAYFRSKAQGAGLKAKE